MNKNEDDFLIVSRRLLDDSLEGLDNSVLSRLQKSRKLALNAVVQTSAPSTKNTFIIPSWLAPVSTGAAFATITLSVTLFWTQPLPQKVHNDNFMEDINLLSQSEELDLYQNLEFYLWLEDETTS